jgi:hypothetical protein
VSKDVAVASRSGQGQDEYVFLDAVDEQPVRQDVALSVSGKVAGRSGPRFFAGSKIPCANFAMTSSGKDISMLRLSIAL